MNIRHQITYLPNLLILAIHQNLNDIQKSDYTQWGIHHRHVGFGEETGKNSPKFHLLILICIAYCYTLTIYFTYLFFYTGVSETGQRTKIIMVVVSIVLVDVFVAFSTLLGTFLRSRMEGNSICQMACNLSSICRVIMFVTPFINYIDLNYSILMSYL